MIDIFSLVYFSSRFFKFRIVFPFILLCDLEFVVIMMLRALMISEVVQKSTVKAMQGSFILFYALFCWIG